MIRTTVMGVGLVLAACVTTEEAVSTATGALIEARCPRYGCDTNAATIGDGILFDELDLSGLPSAGGVRIGGAVLRDHTSVTLDVEGDRLVAHGVRDPLQRHTGDDLDGMMIWLFHAKGPGEPEELFWLHIRVILDQDPAALHFWAGAPIGLESYEVTALRSRHRPPEPEDFKIPMPGDFDITVCLGDLLETDWPGAAVHAAVVYQGDHLDAEHRRVEPPSSPTLFNLACVGTSMAKLHLLRHTEASAFAGGNYPTDRWQRTAMLKTLNADYCGTGDSFTIDGTPLRWQDSTGYMPSLGIAPGVPVKSVEAIWGSSGAVCLDQPRLHKRLEIEAYCDLPACGDVSDWTSRGHVISVNPPR